MAINQECDFCDKIVPCKCGHEQNMHLYNTDNCATKDCKCSSYRVEKINNLWVCAEHRNEANAKKEEKTEHKAPLNVNDVMRQNPIVMKKDEEIRVDIFNRETLAISKLYEAIDLDTTITNKPFEKANRMDAHIKSLRDDIFGLNEQVKEKHEQIRAWQSKYNVIVNHLRAEEREKLQVQNIAYKPPAVRQVRTPISKKNLKATSKRVSTNDLVDACERLKKIGMLMSPSTLKIFMTSKGITLTTAFEQLKATYLEGKAIQDKINKEDEKPSTN